MKKSKSYHNFLIIGILLCFIGKQKVFAQDKTTLHGKVIADTISNISVNIINKTSGKGRISKKDGTFSIEAALGDEIEISYMGFETVTLPIDDKEILEVGEFEVRLREDENILDEVKLSNKALTGLVEFDGPRQEYIDQTQFGFAPYDGPKLTKRERQLSAIGTGPEQLFYMLTGKVKQMKKIIVEDKKHTRHQKVIDDFPKHFFTEQLKIKEKDIDRFLYFCENFEEFETLANSQPSMDFVEFLKEKSGEFYEE